MIQLKEYQRSAVSNLAGKIERCLRSSENKVVVFKAPTGSGKTLMVSEVLKELVKSAAENLKLSFVWISVRMLHEQSKEKLEKYYEDDRLLKCSYFEDLEDRKIGENEILFINWHSINKRDINIYVKENEQENDLGSIIRNTKDEGRIIIMIIDESHHTASSDKSRDLIELIGPKVTLEVSATPKTSIPSEVEEVDLDMVKAEGMIKNEIAINPEFLSIQIGDRSSDDIVIEQTLKKREELAELYKKEGTNINPLVLVQLPDSRENLLNKKDEVVDKLKKRNITEENGKLAIWLSEEKTDNLENIEKFDDKVEVLVFKQAIAVGWDCPRAAILIIFRESKSFIFTIQTIGRIMRMPELKHYDEEELNKGFVFTNLPHIEIAEDYVKDYLTLYEAKRDNKIYIPLALPSVYLKRQRERTRLGGKFVDIFQRISDEINLKGKINFTPSKSKLQVVADATLKDVDKIGRLTSRGKVEFYLDEDELQFAFDKFLVENCTPYAAKDSGDRMTTAVATFLKLKRFDTQLQRIVLSSDNKQAFVDAINLSKEAYKREVIDSLNEKREIIAEPKWEVPLTVSYNSRYKAQDKAKSVMKPFYIAKQSEPEANFIKLLEEPKKVVWWFKNGETESKYFAVLRTDGFTFYPDFIVQFEDGTVGLFDTKSGRTAETEDAGPRAEGLQKYIKEQNKKGKRLWGGIVINVNGSWRYNDNAVYNYNSNDLSKWKVLEI